MSYLNARNVEWGKLSNAPFLLKSWTFFERFGLKKFGQITFLQSWQTGNTCQHLECRQLVDQIRRHPRIRNLGAIISINFRAAICGDAVDELGLVTGDHSPDTLYCFVAKRIFKRKRLVQFLLWRCPLWENVSHTKLWNIFLRTWPYRQWRSYIFTNRMVQLF